MIYVHVSAINHRNAIFVLVLIKTSMSMECRPAILALLLTSWNVMSLSSHEFSWHMLDRIAISVAYAIMAECLCIMSFNTISWMLIFPGIFIWVSLLFYRFFLQEKDINTGVSVGEVEWEGYDSVST